MELSTAKGVSQLYDAGALGGVVNLIARRPTAEPESDFLLNRSSRGATDAVAFLAGPLTEPLAGVAPRRRALAVHDGCER